MEDKYSVEEARSIKIGLAVALFILVIAVVFASLKKNIDVEGKSYILKATFGRTDGLLVGDKVRMAGIDIGRIVGAKLDDQFHAILSLDIKSRIKVPDDSSASIVSSGIMGSKYIEVEPGGSEEFLPADGEFAYTQDAMVLEELVDRIISMGKANRSPQDLKKMEEFEENMD